MNLKVVKQFFVGKPLANNYSLFGMNTRKYYFNNNTNLYYVKHYTYLLRRLKLENREDVLNESDADVK